MKHTTYLLTLLLLCSLSLHATVYNGTCGDNLTWTLDTETRVLEISGTGAMDSAPWATYGSSIETVVINSGVTNIGDLAFYGIGLKSISIPNTVTSIGWAAFYFCTQLASLDLPNSVTTIGQGSFDGCMGLTSLVIPSSVTSIAWSAFSSCSGLTSIVVESGNPIYDSRDNCNAIIETATNKLIEGCKNTVIPSSVTVIGDRAFWNRGVTSITIPDNITSIEHEAFAHCGGMTSLLIPSSVTSIGDFAFSACSGLTSIVVDAGNPVYDSRNNCNAIIETASNKLIAGCDNTVIPDNVTSLGDGVFQNCAGLTSVTLSNSVTSIGDQAFRACSGLSSITIPGSVTSIKSGAFYECHNITDVYCSANPANLTWVSPNSGFKDNKATNFHVYDAEAWESAFPTANVTFVGDLSNYMCGENLTWDFTNGVLTISGTGPMYDWERPEDAPWYSYRTSITSVIFNDGVTHIGNEAFRSYSNMTSVSIPNSVTSIGNYAFCWCNSLPISIPNSVTSIGHEALHDCYVLTSFNLSANVTSLGKNPISGCSNLTSITVDSNNTKYDSRDNCNAIIETATNELVSACINTIIPNSVTSIGDLAFEYVGITSIDLPNGITSIGNAAFYACDALTSITIPSSVNRIDYVAFWACNASDVYCSANPSNLTWVSPNSDFKDNKATLFHVFDSLAWATAFPTANVTFVGDLSNYMCGDNLTWDLTDSVLTISGTGPMYDWESGDDLPWSVSRESISTVIINDGVTTIGKNAFSFCNNLKSVIIPNGVTNIGPGAFIACGRLASVTIPNSVTRIEESAFNASGLKSVTIPGSVTHMGSYSFCQTPLRSVVIEEGVTSIGSVAFEYCHSLTDVSIPNSVTTIGDGAFLQCPLTSVTIPSSVTAIYGNPFAECSHLTSISVDANNSKYDSRNNCNAIIETAINKLLSGCHNTIIPASTISIGTQAFRGCNLTSITIPNSVTSIGELAFYGCGLTSITLPANVTNIATHAFSSNPELATIVVESGNPKFDSRNNCNAIIETATKRLVLGCKNTIFPDSITSIGERAFHGCTGLTSITIPDGVTDIEYEAFRACSNLRSITIPNTVTNIGVCCFVGCGLTSVTIPRSVAYISSDAFHGCGYMDSVVFINSTPPTIECTSSFINTNCNFYVPCGCGSAYVSALNRDVCYAYEYYSIDASRVIETSMFPYAYTILSADTTLGNVTVLQEPTCEDQTLIIRADAKNNNTFKQWSDGNTDNPRSILVTQDTTFVAEFDRCYIAEGTCGEQLTWKLYCDSVLEISGSGPMFDWESGENVPWHELRENIRTVIVSNGVTRIGKNAFNDSYNLTSAYIPNSVTSIGPGGFFLCRSLTSVTIPNSVTRIEESAFNASGLTSVTIPGSVTEMGSFAFIATPLTSVTIENGATEIGAAAFCDCGLLTSVAIPNSVTTIGGDAFTNCAITSIELSNNLSHIGGGAFGSCRRLTSVTIPSSVTTIDNNPFGGCSNLTSIIVDSNNPKYDSRNNCNAIIETASNKLISGCQNTIFPANITTIEKEAFVGCTGLTSITIPNSVRKIGERAFWGCSGLTSVIISSGVRTIEGEAFLDCPRIASIVVDPNNPIFDSRDSCNAIIEKATNKLIVGCAGTTFPTSITTIGDYALRGCGIRTINVPNNVTHIGTDAFRECDSLVSAILPNSITSISNCLFCWCHNLTSVTIPNSVTSIGEDAFAECGFTSIIIPNSVTSLSTNAFVWCRSLMSVTIPSSVTFIGENAFTGCSEVYDVYCSANPANLTWINFNNCFRENKNTVCHVYDVAAWQTKFPDANVTFVGDLAPHDLQELIDQVLDLYDNSVEGQEIGQYQPGARAELYASIYAVSAQITDDMTSDQVNSCIDQLNEAIELFQSRLITSIINTDITQFDNVVFFNELECRAGTEATLPIQMRNQDPVIGYNFKLYLPEGITVATGTDEWGDDVIYAGLSGNRTNAIRHTFVTSLNDEGVLTVLCYSNKAYSFAGNDGEVGYIKVNVDENLAEGEYPIIIREEAISLNGSTPQIGFIQSSIIVSRYKLGDANGDTFINVGDITAVASYILENTPADFVEQAADANEDGAINVGDITTIANMILNDENLAPARRGETDAEMYMDAQFELNINQVSKSGMVLNVGANNSENAFSAFQFDVLLPENVQVTDIQLQSRCNNLAFDMTMLDSHSLRVIAYSMNDTRVPLTSGDLVSITLNGISTDDFTLTNGVFANSQVTLYASNLVASYNMPTNVEDIESDKPGEIYDILGRKLNQCQKGLQIVGNKVIFIK